MHRDRSVGFDKIAQERTFCVRRYQGPKLGCDTGRSQITILNKLLPWKSPLPQERPNEAKVPSVSWAEVGDCAFREGGVFSFISVDCGLRVGDREARTKKRESLCRRAELAQGDGRITSDVKCEDEEKCLRRAHAGFPANPGACRTSSNPNREGKL